jgi:hypothetical protein
MTETVKDLPVPWNAAWGATPIKWKGERNG